ncbi:MAG: glycosyltransferase [Bacteroidota bacterium]|nr:glycosyltransferase [Bacteroidota bacterium]
MSAISIIIPNYNHAAFLQKRIESIINQTLQDFEIIILDDCSNDESKDIIEKYRQHPKVAHIVYNETNSGSPFKQWIKGIGLAKGTYIWIAESDDWSDIEFLNKVIPKLETDPEISLCFCRSYRTNEEGNIEGDHLWADQIDSLKWKQDYVNDGNDEIYNYLVYRNTIANASACVFRKDALAEYNFLSDFLYCGDWLLWIKLIENRKIAFIPEKLNYFRRGTNSTTLRKVKIEKEFIRLKEYFTIINYCKKKNMLFNIYQINKYEWIISDWMTKFDLQKNKYMVLFPPIPFHLLLVFYCRVLKSFIGSKLKLQ